MIVHPADKTTVQWAIEHGYMFGYVREHGLPDPSLRVCMGLSSAYFNAGQLVQWRAAADGQEMDGLMMELASLFGFCTLSRGYLFEEMVRLKSGSRFRRQADHSN